MFHVDTSSVVFGSCAFGTSHPQNSRVEFEVEFLGNIVVLLEIFHQSGIFLSCLLALSRDEREGFQNYKFNTCFLRTFYVGKQIPHLVLWFLPVEQ